MRDGSRMNKRYSKVFITEALETAKQRLTPLATRLKRYERSRGRRNEWPVLHSRSQKLARSIQVVLSTTKEQQHIWEEQVSQVPSGWRERKADNQQ